MGTNFFSLPYASLSIVKKPESLLKGLLYTFHYWFSDFNLLWSQSLKIWVHEIIDTIWDFSSEELEWKIHWKESLLLNKTELDANHVLQFIKIHQSYFHGPIIQLNYSQGHKNEAKVIED